MKRVVGFVIVSTYACAVGWTQVPEQMLGSVQDASGVAVPGAQFTATQIKTGLWRTIDSAANGIFVLTNLPIGQNRLVTNVCAGAREASDSRSDFAISGKTRVVRGVLRAYQSHSQVRRFSVRPRTVLTLA